MPTEPEENEILKKRPLPNVPNDVYEAYYYHIYDGKMI